MRLREWQKAFDLLPKKEKIFFLILFFTAWISGVFILVKIDRDYSTKVPATGGKLTEGIMGIPKFINPLLTVSDADRDLTRVIYAGLMKPDGKGGLEPELAEHYAISADGFTYTFYLREKLYWHDNEKVKAEDVFFTINQAKNPKIASPKRANWEGVTAEVVNDREIKFHLRKPYAPFLANTTLGILPKHIWEKVAPEEFHLSEFNTRPIGAGPFKMESLSKNQIGSITKYTLRRFKNYFREVYIDEVEFIFFPSRTELSDALTQGSITSAGITPPKELKNSRTVDISLPLIYAVFFNKDHFALLQDIGLREALELAIDRNEIVKRSENGHGMPTSLPIPPRAFSYASTLENFETNIDKAKGLLEKSGYKDTDGDGIIEKVSKKERVPLRFSLAVPNTPELVRTAGYLKEVWHSIGIDLKVEIFEIGDLEQSIIRPREYDTLLFGQVLGNDPDPFAFWHSSQRNHPGSNIALYINTKVDRLVEDSRTIVDPEKREELLKFFQQELTKDKPAIFLYSPVYSYTTPKNLSGMQTQQIPIPAERFSEIANWHMEKRALWNIFMRDK